MDAKGLRVVLRWTHIVLGLVIMCYIYSPFSQYKLFQVLIKFVIIPLITFTGIWVWKFKAFNQFFKVRS